MQARHCRPVFNCLVVDHHGHDVWGPNIARNIAVHCSVVLYDSPISSCTRYCLLPLLLYGQLATAAGPFLPANQQATMVRCPQKLCVCGTCDRGIHYLSVWEFLTVKTVLAGLYSALSGCLCSRDMVAHRLQVLQ